MAAPFLRTVALCFGLGLAVSGGVAADATAGPASAAAPGLRLHVPSPDWRDQVIYFVMTDRFADGDPSNNDQGAGEFKAGERSRFNGGDLRGLRERLAYIQGLGATALWITPPVANQWVDTNGYTGYHGYWTEHFMRVDRHLGTLDEYRALSDALHRRGMYLVQDIVLNHTGNYFSYGDWQPRDPQRAWRSWQGHTGTPPVPRPTQPPFDQNDPRDPRQRAAAIYHWTPDVADYTSPVQEATFQMSGLDDLNTENPVVRRALRESYGYWVREVGVDAFRVDTAFYVPPALFEDFLRARDPVAPGIERVALATGRRAFHVFGEGFGIDKPFRDEQARKIERYMQGPGGRPVMPGMLNFPLYGALGDAFARGRPPAELAHRITRTMQLHARPHLMPTFVDNHDVDRFLAGGTVPGLRQALLAQFTLPGIPVVYYGTEQGFTEVRAAMFAAGWGSGGRDRYDTDAPLYRDIAAMAALRRTQRLFSRGTPTVRHANAARPGALVWTTRHHEPGDPAASGTALVALNSADAPTLAAAVDTGLPAGTRLVPLYGLDGLPPPLVVGAGGWITLTLPARAGQVWRAEPAAAAAATAPSPQVPQLDPLRKAQVAGDFQVQGRAAPGAGLRLVVDGDLAGARTLQADAVGRWRATVDTAAMVDPSLRHTVTVVAEDGAAAAPQAFRVQPTWQPLARADDPAGDDVGPDPARWGRYQYPTRPSYRENRQMDLRAVAVAGAGGALRIDVTMGRLTTLWNPANGFDHVALTVFIELPGQGEGRTVMPLQQGSLPEGMRWHRRLRVGGWMNALFAWEGADAQNEGRPVAPGAMLTVDVARRTVRMVLPSAALGTGGRADALKGARVWVTTWDYDGGYRASSPEPQTNALGAPEGSPRVMDASAVITLP